MCIGIPMQVIETGLASALCEGMGQQRQVDTMLVGEQPVGTWLLVFLNSAREVLTEGNAIKITNAVKAVDIVMQNPASHSEKGLDQGVLEALFSDLINREPQLPDFVQNQQSRTKAGEK